MNSTETSNETFVKTVSTIQLIAGVFTLGIGGFLFLSGIAYAMVTENLALGLVCGLLLVSPYVLGIAWVFGWGSMAIADSVPGKTKELASAFSKK